MIAAEPEHADISVTGESNTEAAAEIFLEPSGSGETLAVLDDLRKPAGTAVVTGPELPAGRGILGDRDHGGNADVVMPRQGCATGATELGKRPAEPRHMA